FPEHAQEVPLLSAIRKIVVDEEDQCHGRAMLLTCWPVSCSREFSTSSGGLRWKHGGCTENVPSAVPDITVGPSYRHFLLMQGAQGKVETRCLWLRPKVPANPGLVGPYNDTVGVASAAARWPRPVSTATTPQAVAICLAMPVSVCRGSTVAPLMPSTIASARRRSASLPQGRATR